MDKKLTVFSLKASAHALCEGGQCNQGQRDGLKFTDITDIATLYGTTCGKSIIKTFTVYTIVLFILSFMIYIICLEYLLSSNLIYRLKTEAINDSSAVCGASCASMKCNMILKTLKRICIVYFIKS